MTNLKRVKQMRISDLEAFAKLYQLQSFTKTAQQIHLSQSELSKRLRALQDELNVPLIDTTNRRQLKVTLQGKIVYEYSCRILQQYQQMMADLEKSRTAVTNQLLVGTVPIAGQYRIAECVVHFNEQYPQTKVSLLEEEGIMVIKQLIEGKIDGALLRDTQTNQLSDVLYQKERLATDSLVVVMGKNNPLSHHTAISFAALRNKRIASLPVGSGVYEPIIKLFKENDETPQIFFQSTHIETLTALLRDPDVVTILFRQSAQPFMNDQLVMRPLKTSFVSELQFVYPRKRGSYSLRHLQEYLHDYLNQ